MSAGLSSPPLEGIRNGRILVIDDSAFFRSLLAEMLVADGHEVLGARSAAEAWERIETGPPPDLVLLDLVLPGLDGRRLLRGLRERFSPEELPVIVLTEVVANERDLERLARLGCSGTLNKLAPPDHVRFRVRSTLHPVEADRRRRGRVALSLGLQYRVVGPACRARTHTLSADGAYVRSEAPPPIGSRIELSLELGEPGRTVAITGEVVRREDAPGDERAPRGFAVRFLDLAPEDRATLAELLARIDATGL